MDIIRYISEVDGNKVEAAYNLLNTIHASIHTRSYYHKINTQKTATPFVEGVSEDFHVYRIEWQMLVDYVRVYQSNEIMGLTR